MDIKSLITVYNIAMVAMVIITIVVLFKKGALSDFLNAFNNNPGGHSGRKLTAFGFAVLAAYCHYKGFSLGYIDKSNIVSVILIDVAVVLLALALIDFKDILRFKNGDKIPADENKV